MIPGYEFYKLGQAYSSLFARNLDPYFDNPLTNYIIDQWVNTMLKVWFWPGAVVEMQQQFEEVQEFWSPWCGNLCKPG